MRPDFFIEAGTSPNIAEIGRAGIDIGAL